MSYDFSYKDDSGAALQDDVLRPSRWDEYVGQEQVKRTLELMMQAAKRRKEPCDHILFHGQAGLGKTTLAYLIGKEMGARVRTVAGPSLERAGDVAALLSSLEPYDILFVDEIHRLGKHIEEMLYPALDARKLHLVVGKGVSAKSVSLNIAPFTFIGATTRAHLLSMPLRTRFGAALTLQYYDVSDIIKILAHSAELLGIPLGLRATELLAHASRRTPRVANRLLRRSRDYAEVHGGGNIDEEVVRATMELLRIDSLGLEEQDRDFLSLIIKKFGGGPVGLPTLAAALHEDPSFITELYEPFLMGIGFLERTRRGRVVTAEARRHIGFYGGKNKG